MPVRRLTPYKATRTTQLPSVPGLGDANLRSFLESVKQFLEVGEGVRGDPKDTKLTVRDLEAIGVLEVQGAGIVAGSDIKNPDEPGAGSIGDDGLPIVTTPPAVRGLTVSGLFTRVMLVWEPERYSNHDRVDIFRATVDDFGQAVRVGSSTGVMYADVVGGAWTGYYWVRNVSTQGVNGPVVGPKSAETPPDPNYLIDILEDKLDESVLAQHLRERIDLVDGPDTLTGSVASRLKQLDSEIDAQIDVIESQIADLAATPEFDENEDWAENTIARYEGGLYRALQNMTAPSPLPTDDQYWEKIGDYASLGEAVVAHAASLESHETRITENEGSLSSQAKTISQLETGVQDLEQDVATRATKTELNQAISDEESARILSINNLEASLQSDIDTKAAITYVDQAISDEESARVSAISSLETSLQGQIDSKAEITQLNEAISDEQQARTTAITSLETSLQSDIDSKASITQLNDAISDEESARALAVTQLQVDIDGNEAAIQTKASVSAVSDLENDMANVKAEYSVRLNANNHAVGFGLVAGGGNPSKFAIVADEFAIAGPNGEESSPFFHLTSQQTVNGVTLEPGTYMDAAFIGSAQIGDAQIGEVGVDKISGAIGNFIMSNIEHGSITNAYIGSFIRSNNWPNGGWNLDKGGTFHLRSGRTGARLEITPNRINVHDGRRLRVRIGQL